MADASGGPRQRISVSPGLTFIRAHFYIPPGTETTGKMQLAVNVWGDKGTNLYAIRTEPISLSEAVGEWTAVELLEYVPEMREGEKIEKIQPVLLIQSAGEDVKVYVDDFVVY